MTKKENRKEPLIYHRKENTNYMSAVATPQNVLLDIMKSLENYPVKSFILYEFQWAEHKPKKRDKQEYPANEKGELNKK